MPRKDTTVSISITKKEKEEWAKIVKQLDISMSSFIRKAVNVYIAMIKKQWEVQGKS